MYMFLIATNWVNKLLGVTRNRKNREWAESMTGVLVALGRTE